MITNMNNIKKGDYNSKTFSRNVVERFLKGEELETFLKLYTQNKGGWGTNRGHMLQQPITKDDLFVLREYATNPERPLTEVAQELGVHFSALYGRALRVAIRVIAQHPEILDQVQVEEGKKLSMTPSTTG